MNAEHRILINAGEPVAVQWRGVNPPAMPHAIEQQLSTSETTRRLAPRFRESHLAGFTMAGPDGWYTTVLVPPKPLTPEELAAAAVTSMREARAQLQGDKKAMLIALGDAMSHLLHRLGHADVASLWDTSP